MKKYDVIVIGTGAGNTIIEEATKKGLKCAQIEKGKFGGTCLTRGCIPTKVMVTAAEELRRAKEGSKIGVLADNVRVDWETLSKRVWNKIDESIELREFYLAEENVDVYEGTGYFLSDKVVAVDIRREDGSIDKIEMTADKIFINVGGRTNVVEFPGLKETGYITSESFFGDKYPDKPYEELIVMGGGAIGTEFASTFASLGTKVTLVQRNVRLLPKEDEDISPLVKGYMEEIGVNVLLNKVAVSLKAENGKKILTIEDKTTGEQMEVRGDEILLASGIVPNSDSLHLENTNIQTDDRGWIRTNEFLETSVEGVWAIGDINGKQQFRHKANYEADIVAHNLFISESIDDIRWARYDLVPAVTFCYPEVAHVGMTEKEAREKGYTLEIGLNRYAMTAKGYAMGFDMEDDLDAFAKMIVDKESGDILGMHVIGPMASTLIQPYLLHMNLGKHRIAPINEDIETPFSRKMRNMQVKRKLKPHRLRSIRETMVPHPTLSEVSVWTFYNMKDAEK